MTDTGGGSVQETTGNQSQMRSALFSGLDTLDLNQTVTWTLYTRTVLPADGFVFWVKADVLTPGGINSAPLNRVPLNTSAYLSQPAPTFSAQGSLHHTTVNRQEETENFSVNRMVFTSKVPINPLSAVAPGQMYLATIDGNRYAFSTRSMRYQQAGLHHYSGDAVYPALATQIIDYPAQINQRDVVVSNSLPLWLTFNWLFPVFPSFLVPDNQPPPYAAVHIGEEDTHPMQAGTYRDTTGSLWQLARDTVHVTFYGVRNNTIMDWLEMVKEYTLTYQAPLGVMNSPVPKDAKRNQVELNILAQKKVVAFEASYYQARVLQLSLKLIKSAFIDIFDIPAPPPPPPSFYPSLDYSLTPNSQYGGI